MGKISAKRRQFRIRNRKKKKTKIQKLIQEHSEAKTKEKKDEIIEKIQRLSAQYPMKNILN